MKGFIKKIGAAALAGCMAFSFLGCGSDDDEIVYYDNEEDPLLLSTLELDGVFNPFFSSSATDSSVVGMTQLGMLANDEEGHLVYGENEETLVLDYECITEGEKGEDGKEDTRKTTYYFVLKNNVKFSNGSPVTMKDVLFNLYVYLDMAYTCSSTIYSTDIVGLQEYRTQEESENEQNSFMQKYQAAANDRIDALKSAWNSLGYDSSSIPEYTENEVRTKLQEIQDKGDAINAHLVDDYNAALRLFKEELNNDWSNSLNSYSDIVFKDEAGNEYKDLFTTDVEAFLYNEGKITWSKKDGKLSSSYTTPGNEATLKKWTKEQAINRVYNENIPDKLGDQILEYWATAYNLFEELTNDELDRASDNIEKKFKSIEGIKFANGGAERGGAPSVEVNGKTYNTPTYKEDGSVANGNEVLTIQINGVDPKAKWNFAFTVAPMYYYSSPALIEKFDYVENFGVQWNSQSFMNNVVKNPDKIGVPVGAGPYMASKSSGGTDNVTASDFRSTGIIYYERNPYYLKPVKIKKVRYVVVASNQMTTDLYSGRVDYSEPNAKPETTAELKARKGVDYKEAKTNGYGYIGINASKIPYINVRRAIMYSINTNLCVSYYKSTAEIIHRSMSKESDYYPEGATAYYPFIGGEIPQNLNVVDPAYKKFVEMKGKRAGQTFSDAEQKEFIKTLLEDPGSLDPDIDTNKYKFTLNNGIYKKGDHTCKYTFSIAGEVTDHPAWSALYNASTLLNQCGFEVTVRTDAQALQKLASGQLTVWAAAWSSTIDPDMYQVYHKDSKATSVQNWGYPAILRNSANRYDIENGILNTLSDYIELGREYEDYDDRYKYYEAALDEVMKLAVELPTYQRKDVYAYNEKKVDGSTLFNPSAFKGPLGDLYNVSLIVKTEIA
ncbi:MAG: hypothetical protein K2M48_00165 [Clostridiales bacterium]|nr:hypothetical protein [Clostridiales bacterium]